VKCASVCFISLCVRVSECACHPPPHTCTQMTSMHHSHAPHLFLSVSHRAGQSQAFRGVHDVVAVLTQSRARLHGHQPALTCRTRMATCGRCTQTRYTPTQRTPTSSSPTLTRRRRSSSRHQTRPRRSSRSWSNVGWRWLSCGQRETTLQRESGHFSHRVATLLQTPSLQASLRRERGLLGGAISPSQQPRLSVPWARP
jgi:hypothetical protein